MSRPDWVPYFMGIAWAVAERGDCTRTQVGAVLVRPDHTIASTGYNGAPRGVRGCLEGACPRGRLSHQELPPFEAGGASADFSSCIALHAELNALAFAREDTTGFIMVVTRQPCEQCAKIMQAHRLEAVWYPQEGYPYRCMVLS